MSVCPCSTGPVPPTTPPPPPPSHPQSSVSDCGSVVRFHCLLRRQIEGNQVIHNENIGTVSAALNTSASGPALTELTPAALYY